MKRQVNPIDVTLQYYPKTGPALLVLVPGTADLLSGDRTEPLRRRVTAGTGY